MQQSVCSFWGDAVKRPTIIDVARQAGVSITTVSHVVNSTRFVEEPTRERVVLAISNLGYRPNQAARSLITHRTNLVGLIASSATNYFFGSILLGVESVLRPAGYGIIVCNTAETPVREAQALELLLSLGVDGMLVAGVSEPSDALRRAEAEGVALVFIDRYFEGLRGTLVVSNHEEAAFIATSYLLDAGHSNIGMVAGSPRVRAVHRRVAGWTRALNDRGIAVQPGSMIFCESQPEPARQATRELLARPEPPTAIFVNNNVMALGVLLELRSLGLSCPRDISIIGFDDNPWWEVTSPPLTAMRQPSRELGQVGAELLLERMRDERVVAQEVTLSCELVFRESVAPPSR